jgi:hypothetical protein
VKKLPVIGLIVAAIAGCIAFVTRKKAAPMPVEQMPSTAEAPPAAETPQDTPSA